MSKPLFYFLVGDSVIAARQRMLNSQGDKMVAIPKRRPPLLAADHKSSGDVFSHRSQGVGVEAGGRYSLVAWE